MNKDPINAFFFGWILALVISCMIAFHYILYQIGKMLWGHTIGIWIVGGFIILTIICTIIMLLEK